MRRKVREAVRHTNKQKQIIPILNILSCAILTCWLRCWWISRTRTPFHTPTIALPSIITPPSITLTPPSVCHGSGPSVTSSPFTTTSPPSHVIPIVWLETLGTTVEPSKFSISVRIRICAFPARTWAQSVVLVVSTGLASIIFSTILSFVDTRWITSTLAAPVS